MARTRIKSSSLNNGNILPGCSPAGRLTTPQNGQMGLNTTLGYIEWYNISSSSWAPIYSPPAYFVSYLVVAGGGGGQFGYTGGGSGVAGTVNTGGGGGGNTGGGASGAAGGSGIVIIRYPGSQRGTGGTITSAGGYTIHTFTGSGTFTA